jgi:hypothetical protein
MSQGARFLNHKGKSIYYVDYSNIGTKEEFLEIIKQTHAFREIVKAEGKRDQLMLVDVTGSFIYGEILEEIKVGGKETREIISKQAVVGITGSKKVLLNIFNKVTQMEMKVFGTVEDALNWLVTE